MFCSDSFLENTNQGLASHPTIREIAKISALKDWYSASISIRKLPILNIVGLR